MPPARATNWLMWTAIFVSILSSAVASGQVFESVCDPVGELITVTELYGIVTDGPDEYRPSSKCHWLIQPNITADPTRYAGSVLVLDFMFYDLEAGYDAVNIYDGK